jgi:hypothetical protein
MDTRTLLIRCAALLTAGAALIHVGVTGSHFQQWWAAGLFFLVAALAQFGWAVWCWTKPASRSILLAGAAGSAALVLVWAVTRTTGLPFGPEAGVAESAGLADVLCVGLEVASGALALVATLGLARERLMHPAPRRAAMLTAGVAALVVVASGTALAAPEHDHTEATAVDHTHSADPSSVAAHDHHDVPNLPDVSKATAEQTATAKGLLDETIAATSAYRDPAAATKAGFDVQAAWDRKQKKVAATGRTPKKAGVGMVHVPNRANRTDGKVLDPNAPETLVYTHAADGTFHLVGVMFTAEKKTPPTSYQPYVRWHTHEGCIGGGLAKAKPVDGVCAKGTTARTSGAMTHVWFVADTDLTQAFALKVPLNAVLAYQRSLA